MRSSLLEDGGGASSEASPCECEERLKELKNRLEVVALDPPLEALQMPPTLETHGDFLLKEMAWMAADFEVESEGQSLVIFRSLLDVRCVQGNGMQFSGRKDQRLFFFVFVRNIAFA